MTVRQNQKNQVGADTTTRCHWCFLKKSWDGFNVRPINLGLIRWKMWLKDIKGKKDQIKTARRQIIIRLHFISKQRLFLSTLSRLHAARGCFGHAAQGSDPGHARRVLDPVPTFRDLLPIQHEDNFLLAGSVNHLPQPALIQQHVATKNPNCKCCNVTLLLKRSTFACELQ